MPDPAVEILHERWQAEIALLACVCPLGGKGIEIATTAGISLLSFASDEARAMWIACLEADHAGLTSVLDCARCLRLELCAVDRYDPEETRPFAVIEGSKWGDAAISAIMLRLTYDEAASELPIAARALLRLGTAEEKLMKGVPWAARH